MTAHTRSFAAVLLALGVAARGPAAPPTAGRVLLLDNQHVLEGEVERAGDQYRVRRDGGETLVSANRALAVCDSLEAAYKFLRDRADPRDAAAHLRLARWCDANNLRAQAAAEAKAAVELRPTWREARGLFTMLQQRAAAPMPTPVPAQPPPPAAPAALADPIDCGAEAFKRFATKVQPVLMNTCASCHAGANAGSFRLQPAYADGLNSRTATQRNLAAALAQIDRGRPSASPLLLRALAAHGGAAVPPLRDHDVPPYRLLEEWVKLVLPDSSPAPAPAAPATPAVVPTSHTTAAPPAKADTEPQTAFGSGNAPPPKEEPKDPFDPADFNRQHHPGGAKPDPAPKP
jgi:hypothetical protein